MDTWISAALHWHSVLRGAEWLQYSRDVPSAWCWKDSIRVQLSGLQVQQSQLHGGANEKALQWRLHVLLPKSWCEDVSIVTSGESQLSFGVLSFKAWKLCWILWSLQTVSTRQSLVYSGITSWELSGQNTSKLQELLTPFINIWLYSCYHSKLKLRAGTLVF